MPLYLLACIFIRIIFLEISWASYLAVMISVYQFLLLFNSIGTVIPIRYLFGSFMCIQFFIGPTFAYNGLDAYQYFMYIMRIPEAEYFSYAIPAVVLFIFGLHINAGKLKGEFIDRAGISMFVQRNPKMPYIFIIIGLFASLLTNFFTSDLAFVFYLLGSFKFIGLFLIILGWRRLKPLPVVIVIGSIISSSLGEGMFHDLITWLIFTISVFAIRYRFEYKTKLIGAAVFLVMVLLIQVLKGSYRSTIGSNKEEAGVETLARLAEEKNSEKGLLSFESLAQSNVRINQGFIITNIMKTVPAQIPYEDGRQMVKIFEAAILPRILAPDKLRAGDKEIFTKYSGIRLRQGTSMALSSLGDAYLNFGTIGGCVFMFLLGWLYSSVLNVFHKHSRMYPVLILFTAMVFYYPIRPDCELQTILGHLFKGCFLIFVMLKVWKYNFAMPPYLNKNPEIQPLQTQ